MQFSNMIGTTFLSISNFGSSTSGFFSSSFGGDSGFGIGSSFLFLSSFFSSFFFVLSSFSFLSSFFFVLSFLSFSSSFSSSSGCSSLGGLILLSYNSLNLFFIFSMKASYSSFSSLVNSFGAELATLFKGAFSFAKISSISLNFFTISGFI